MVEILIGFFMMSFGLILLFYFLSKCADKDNTNRYKCASNKVCDSARAKKSDGR